ncbi:hypothetical protein G9A89_021824 [Geosiphon pyriformis]|nr:hypothetical protein G9A89_021824 [Geosiphon pyriformis]
MSTSNAFITYARDFEAVKLEANYTQAVNLAMNELSELNSKLKQFSDSINQKLEKYLTDNYTIYQPSQWHNNQGNANRFQNQSCPSLLSYQSWQPEMRICYNCDSKPSPESRPIPTHLPVYDVPTNLSNSSLSIAATNNLSDAVTSNISITATSNLSNTYHLNTTSKPSSNDIREPKIENHPKLEIGNRCTSTNSQLFSPTIRISSAEFGHQSHPKPEFPTLFKPFAIQESNNNKPLTNNILSATITENESLDAIFPFELEEPSDTPLFSGAALEEKPIMAMYTDAKVDDHSIKLILDSGSAGSIITQQLMNQLGHRVDRAASVKIITTNGATKTPIGKINDFPIKVNGIIISIKVLVMEATQY